MLIMGILANWNYKRNQRIAQPEDIINGQSICQSAAMRFGLSTISRSGCEVIAVYNALILHDKKRPFADVARYMERYRILVGFWGTNFYMLGICLHHFGIRARRIYKTAELKSALHANRICLYVFWVGRRFCSSIHTVVLADYKDNLQIYNAFNRHGEIVQTGYDNYLKSRRMIMAYVIEE